MFSYKRVSTLTGYEYE